MRFGDDTADGTAGDPSEWVYPADSQGTMDAGYSPPPLVQADADPAAQYAPQQNATDPYSQPSYWIDIFGRAVNGTQPQQTVAVQPSIPWWLWLLGGIGAASVVKEVFNVLR